MAYDKKEFFDQLGEDMEKAAKKNDKKQKEKMKGAKKNQFFDQDLFDNPKKKKSKKDYDKKKKNKDKDKRKAKDFKKSKKEKEINDWDPSENRYEGIGSGNLSKKILKQIKSKDLKEAFKRDKVLIDERKFWTKD